MLLCSSQCKGLCASRKELKRIKSWDLFEKIEMPLVFTLKDMEKAGILVEQKALKEYGDRLGERLTSLEQDIYERAGEEFNINSPKQLGVILFEKMHMPYGRRKPRRGIQLRRKYWKNSVLKIQSWR